MPANAFAKKESHCSETVHTLPPARMSASVRDVGPVTRLAVSHRMGDTIADTRRPVTYGRGLTSRVTELRDDVKEGQKRPSWMGTRIVDAAGDVLVADAMSEPEIDGVKVLKMLCAAELPETVGEVDRTTVHEPRAAPVTEAVVLAEMAGAETMHVEGTRPPRSARYLLK